ncbi:MAG: isochorismatase family protein, partial [Paraburkholderia tropica]
MSAQPRRALVVIDVQNEYVSGDLPIEYPDVHTSLANIGRAIDAARTAGVPVVVVQNFAPAESP